MSSPRASSACAATKGAAPITCGLRARLGQRCAASRAAPRRRAPKISMCETTPSMRSRTSFWKPFITDSTMISAATPSAMPSIDTPEMKEMKPLRRRGAAGAGVAPAQDQFVGKSHRAGYCCIGAHCGIPDNTGDVRRRPLVDSFRLQRAEGCARGPARTWRLPQPGKAAGRRLEPASTGPGRAESPFHAARTRAGPRITALPATDGLHPLGRLAGARRRARDDPGRRPGPASHPATGAWATDHIAMAHPQDLQLDAQTTRRPCWRRCSPSSSRTASPSSSTSVQIAAGRRLVGIQKLCLDAVSSRRVAAGSAALAMRSR